MRAAKEDLHLVREVPELDTNRILKWFSESFFTRYIEDADGVGVYACVNPYNTMFGTRTTLKVGKNLPVRKFEDLPSIYSHQQKPGSERSEMLLIGIWKKS